MNRTMTIGFILLLICSVVSVTASEQPADANGLTSLSDYLRYAAFNNAGLKASFENWKASLEQIPQAKALSDPKFTYSYFIEQIETRVGPQQNKFGIMQVFPWFGEIEARTDAVSAKANAAKQRYEAEKLKLFGEVKEAFYEFSYLDTAIQITNENLQLLTHFEEIARTKYRASSARHPDVIRAQMELALLEEISQSLHTLKEPTVARLNAVLNRPAALDLDWPEKTEPQLIELNRDDIISVVVANNPELAELNWQTQAARAEVELARQKYYPDIGVGVDWIQTGDALNPSVSDSGKDAVVLMFSMNLPLWRDSYAAAERQARAKVRKAQQQQTDAQNQKIFQTIRQLYEIDDSKRKMKLYANVLVTKAQELVESSESAYRAGTIDFLSLIDAERMLLKYQLNYHRAMTNYQQGIAKLEVLTGESY